MKTILLTQGKIALIDDLDFEWLNQWKWYAKKTENCWYAVRQATIKEEEIRKTIRMHRQIMNAQKGQEIDHRNHNGLDNQHSNLRLCNHIQNMQNQIRQNRKNKTSKFKGIYWSRNDKKWKARIRFNGNLICLGSYSSEIEAAKCYDQKARELFGEFAYLNFPEG